MKAESIVGRNVLILCGNCKHRVRKTKASGIDWVKKNCLYIAALDEYVGCVESSELCKSCGQLKLF